MEVSSVCPETMRTRQMASSLPVNWVVKMSKESIKTIATSNQFRIMTHRTAFLLTLYISCEWMMWTMLFLKVFLVWKHHRTIEWTRERASVRHRTGIIRNHISSKCRVWMINIFIIRHSLRFHPNNLASFSLSSFFRQPQKPHLALVSVAGQTNEQTANECDAENENENN